MNNEDVLVKFMTKAGWEEGTLCRSELTVENAARASLITELYGVETITMLQDLSATVDKQSAQINLMTSALNSQSQMIANQNKNLTVMGVALGVSILATTTACVLMVKTHRQAARTDETLQRLIWMDVRAQKDKAAALSKFEAITSELESSLTTSRR